MKTKDAPVTQEILRGLGALGQGPNIRTKDAPGTSITQEITKVLGAWPGAKDKDQKNRFLLFVCLFIYLFIYALNRY